MTFTISMFQFHCQREHKQIKWNKIKHDMCKSDCIFHNLQSIMVFEWLLKNIFWQISKWILTVPVENCLPSDLTP